MTAMLDPVIRKDDGATMPAITVYAGTAPVVKAEDMKKTLPKHEG